MQIWPFTPRDCNAVPPHIKRAYLLAPHTVLVGHYRVQGQVLGRRVAGLAAGHSCLRVARTKVVLQDSLDIRESRRWLREAAAEVDPSPVGVVSLQVALHPLSLLRTIYSESATISAFPSRITSRKILSCAW